MQRDRNSINKTFALTEKSTVVNGVGDMPNQHDVLTGSDSTGRAIAGDMDTTCTNYTSNGDGKGSVMLGHSDRTGGGNSSWNSAHGSRGCSQPIWWLRWCGAAVLASRRTRDPERSTLNFQLHFQIDSLRGDGMGVGS